MTFEGQDGGLGSPPSAGTPDRLPDGRLPSLPSAVIRGDGPITNALRLVAVLATIVRLWVAAFSSPTILDGGPSILVVTAFLLMGCVLVVLLVAREGCLLLARHVDLLVPVGFFFLVDLVLRAGAALPGISSLLGESTAFRVFNIGYSLSVSLILGFVLNTVVTCWLVSLVVSVLCEQPLALDAALRETPAALLRGMAARLVGHLGLCAILTLALALMAALIFLQAFGFFLSALLILPIVVGFNLGLYFVLPFALERRVPFWQAFAGSVRLGLSTWRRTLGPMLLYLVLVGGVPYFTFSRNSFNVKFNMAWVGDFHGSSSWLGVAAGALGVEAAALVTVFLEVALLVVSVVFLLELGRRVDLVRSMDAMLLAAKPNHEDLTREPPAV